MVIGYYGSRGSFEEAVVQMDPNNPYGPALHYPGTYIIGVFDRSTSLIENHRIENEDMVNFPNWMSIQFRYGSKGIYFTKHFKS